MWQWRRKSLAGALAALALASTPVHADPSVDHDTYTAPPEPVLGPLDYQAICNKAFDAVVLRPLGAGATAAGALFFVVAAPLSWYALGIDEVWQTFVMEPVDFTFVRPLGDF